MPAFRVVDGATGSTVRDFLDKCAGNWISSLIEDTEFAVLISLRAWLEWMPQLSVKLELGDHLDKKESITGWCCVATRKTSSYLIASPLCYEENPTSILVFPPSLPGLRAARRIFLPRLFLRNIPG
jgi:hypothetical protein